jgi:hypothetical protein
VSAQTSRADSTPGDEPSVTPEGRTQVAFVSALVALYTIVVFVYLVLPVVKSFGEVLLGSRLLAVDSLLASGIMEWGFQSLYSPTLHFFDWNAGFPLHNTLAITENLLGWQIFYSPLRWLGVGVPAAYNVTLLFSLVISSTGAALFSQRLGASRLGAAAAGLMFGLGPYHLANLMHIQTMSVCWVPFAFLSLDRYLEYRRVRDAVLLTVFSVLTALSGVYFGVFLALMVVIYVICSRLFRRFTGYRSSLVGLAIVGACTAIILSPVIYHYVAFIAANGSYREPVANIASLSMDVTAPLRTPAFQIVWAGTRLGIGTWNAAPAFPGAIATILILIALTTPRAKFGSRRIVYVLAAISVVAYLLALGPRIQVLGRTPHFLSGIPTPGQLWLLIPGIRWPSRMFFFAWLGLGVLVGIGLTRLQTLLTPSAARLAACVTLVLMIGEYWPASWLASQSRQMKQPIAMSDSYVFLSHESDSGGVVELPLLATRGGREDLAATYIYGASGHLRKIVSLHGSRPVPFLDSLERSAQRLPDSASRVVLASAGISRVVVHRFPGDSAYANRTIDALKSVGYAVMFDGTESVVFSLSRR